MYGEVPCGLLPCGSDGTFNPIITEVNGVAEFYALMPTDNPGLIVPGAYYQFPRDGVIIGTDITRVNNDTFNLSPIGIYNVIFNIMSQGTGQLALQINGSTSLINLVGHFNSPSYLPLNRLIQTTEKNTLLRVINPSNNITSLTPGSSDGGSNGLTSSIRIAKISGGCSC